MAQLEVHSRQQVIDEFHQLVYEHAGDSTWADAHWHGVKLWKQPSDLFLYQDLIHRLRPALIIETGTAFGGSALFYAHQLDQIGRGQVITIDLKPYEFTLPQHPRIVYAMGTSSVPISDQVSRHARWGNILGPVMVSLDSDHSQAHVEAELEAYAPLVTYGSYLVVEDCNVNGHPVGSEHGPGPWEALEAWLPKHPEFVEDLQLPKRWLYSWHRWLRKRKL